MVVCDGVSTSHKSETASSAVAQGVIQNLSQALLRDTLDDPASILREAIAYGASQLNASVNLDTRRSSASRKLKRPEENPASTTVVAALVTGGTATIAWVGDSRAYWIDAQSAYPLTRDHSWQNDVVQAGEMSAEQAAKSPKAHAITRWIGPDADPAPADIQTRSLAAPGTLLLCTDGLWNYAATPGQIHALVQSTPDSDALTQARALTQFALDAGGQDNITVALLKITAPQSEA
jgi:serine/threonine protein phosphatase PrpC